MMEESRCQVATESDGPQAVTPKGGWSLTTIKM